MNYRQLLSSFAVYFFFASQLAEVTSLQCDPEQYSCHEGGAISADQVQICHYNGKSFQTLCIKSRNTVRRKQLWTDQDYCGPCSQHKAFETREELQVAVAQYLSESANNEEKSAELAGLYGWPMNDWNVSLIEDFSELFAGQQNFNEDISAWDMRSATDLSMMFWRCEKFQGDLSRWNVHNVRSMDRTFFAAEKFNADISAWQTSQVTNMMGIFWRASSFNQPIGNWDTGKVVDISRAFADAKTFDQDLTGWNTMNAFDMSYMFMQATSFKGDVSNFNVVNVKTMERMFYKVEAYEGPSRQRTLWSAWLPQLEHTINTHDMFSVSNSNGKNMRGSDKNVQEISTDMIVGKDASACSGPFCDSI